MGTPTLSDVARAAGVSYATADRVVNSRGNVAAKSIEKVNAAVAALGYVRNVAAANLSKRRIYRFVFLLPAGPNAFFARMRAHLSLMADHLAQDNIRAEVQEIAAFSASGLEQALRDLHGTDCDGIAAVGLHSRDLEPALAALREQGTQIVGLVSDLPRDHRAAYIGIDNVMAGRTAARLLGMAHGGNPGRVQVLAGSLDAGDHADRFAGFSEVIARDFPAIEILPLIETRDQASKVHDAAMLATRLAATAIYNIGAGNSGLIRALSERPDDGRCICILHELVDHSRRALEAGLIDLIIDQRPDVEINRALTLLRALCDGRPLPPMPELVPTIYVRDNLPGQDMTSFFEGQAQ